MTQFAESTVEQAALDWLASLGYACAFGPDLAFDGFHPQRENYGQVYLPERLKAALARLNPSVPASALDEAYRQTTRPAHPSLPANNHAFHRMLVDGIEVETRAADNRPRSQRVWLVDYEDPEYNDWLAVNQFTVEEGKLNRRPDVVLFVNGLPLAVIELKNAADENATIWSAFNQLQTYKAQIPSLFVYNALLIISDGLNARIGSLTANKEWFLPWKTIEGEGVAPSSVTQLEVLLRGVFDKRRFLDLMRYFIVFEQERGAPVIKKIAGYHQFHAVNIAVEETLRAAKELRAVRELPGRYSASVMKDGKAGDRRIGVVWHTQGAGKSLTMAFYAGRLAVHPAMENPTLIVLTDRNDLDDQLFGTFSRCHEILRQVPEQAENREHLRAKLQGRASGGVIFTTIQKFMPTSESSGALSERHNVVVIADEAHRSQYDFIDGFARHMHDALPNASFIGFTGTPIEHTDRNTRAVFGDYISVYDIQQAVDDGATVKIFYEGRLAKLVMDEKERPKIDPDFEEATEGEELEKKEKLKTKWAALEAVVGAEKRVDLIAQDILDHFDQRLEAMDGKAMIVCMSRRICVALYNAIVALRPEWRSEDDNQGSIKIVMTGNAADPLEWQGHIRNKVRREDLARRFKDPADPFKLVILRDMWLTGFDVPPLHTMYIDKPMQGHGLMQSIARVNRVYKDKPGGLIVDYLGLAYHLQTALAAYTESGHPADTAIDQNVAVAELVKRYEICLGLFHGFDWSLWKKGSPQEKLGLLPLAQEHILKQEDGKSRLLKAVRELSLAFALAVPNDRALAIRDDVASFQAVRSALIKSTVEGERFAEDIDHAIRQILSRAVVTDDIIDIFAAAGLKKPEVSILSEEFLAEVKDLPQKNLAIELLRKLLNDELKTRMRKNLVQSRSFAEMLERTIHAYQNRTLESAEVIAELINLANKIREAQKRGDKMGLSEEEIAFYDALGVNDSAVVVLGDDTLKGIARELVEMVRKNVTIDWTVKEFVRAKLRVMVKHILRKYGYPPDRQEKATQTVLEQAELIAKDWAD
ncbi:MAG: type I restriction endonuclease subunit R [Anaerolineaceae bacterium]|nr:type I restriction endonuclease subunit R [Anaerolineaceae bacterium]